MPCLCDGVLHEHRRDDEESCGDRHLPPEQCPPAPAPRAADAAPRSGQSSRDVAGSRELQRRLEPEHHE
jgi:hypothetical protein